MLKQIIFYFCFLLVPFFNTIPIQAQELSQNTTPVQLTLNAENQTISAGHSFWVSLNFKLDDNWQAYWKNPGDAGMTPLIEWNLPKDFSVDRVEWPAPEKFVVDNIITFGYEGEFEILAQINAPLGLKDKEILDLGANVRWVLCSDDTCLPGESEAKIQLPVSLETAKLSEQGERIQNALANQPRKLEGSASSHNGFVHFAFTLPILNENSKVAFYPESEEIDFHKDPVLKLSQEENRISIPTKSELQVLKGLLSFDDLLYSIEEPVKVSPKEIAQADVLAVDMSSQEEPVIFIKFLKALGCAFLGGMILNLMPCVLPVVSFKVMSFVKMAGKERLAILKHSLAFAFGVLLSFWALAGMLLLLKSYGHAVGWGFQLQDPIFVAIMAAVLLIFGLSQFGVFEFGTSVASLAGSAQMKTISKGGYTVSMMSGVFATAVAAPCTGPFLGSAVGYAITLPPVWSMVIFTSLGLGMAFPYIALAAFPDLLKWMPKPGAWMDDFKQFMGFLMMATVLWLGWVFGAQTSENAIFLLLASFLVISLGCWIYGKWGTPVQRKKVRWISYVLTCLCLTTASFMIYQSLHTYKTPEWETFSKARIEELKAKNVPFLIDFTAKWCLICQSNHRVLNNEEIEKRLDELGVVRIKADWTKNDPDITEELRKFGRSSVPLYVLYGTDSSEGPIFLPQVLTTENVLNSISQAHISNHVTKLH